MSTRSLQLFRFRMYLDQQKFLRYYQGSISNVRVLTECGRRVQFPAMRLRPFLTQTGINGRFQLTVDAENRFVKLQKIS